MHAVSQPLPAASAAAVAAAARGGRETGGGCGTTPASDLPGAGEVLVAVAAAGVNRPDVMQRKGLYPAPAGASDIPGLEIAGRVVALGAGVTRFAMGDAICGLVPGGGYAEYCVVHEANALPVPAGMGLGDAAALPDSGEQYRSGRIAALDPAHDRSDVLAVALLPIHDSARPR
jgi:NADPH:quinone reductase-like Zn-dependent oxidoreductase